MIIGRKAKRIKELESENLKLKNKIHELNKELNSSNKFIEYLKTKFYKSQIRNSDNIKF